MPDAAGRPAAFKACGQSTHTASAAYELMTTAEASNQWYRGTDNYHFASGRPNSQSANVKKSAYQFTQMVWKGSAGKKVGFGVKDKTAVAWYCPTGNDPDTAAAF